MSRHVTLRLAAPVLALLVGLVVGLALSLAQPGSAATPSAPTTGWIPPDNTIVKVEGNKLDGFGVHFFDGSAIFPPTDSESYAECEEYDTLVAVVRCRTEVRIWYRDLSKLKQSLQWARWHYKRLATT